MPRPVRAALLLACLASLPARAFVRTATADGSHFLWWPTRSVGFNIQEDCALRPPPEQVPAAAVDAGETAAQYRANCEAAVKASFLAWQNAGGEGCTDLQLPYLGDTAIREVGYDPNSSTNMNSVLFQPALCDNVIPLTDPCWAAGDCDTAYPDNPCFGRGDSVIALTTTTYEPTDGTLLDADIEINDSPGLFDFSAEQPGDPLPGTTDVENTVTHEAGHFIGLAHNCGGPPAPACTPTLASGVMYWSANPGETIKRTLKQDDIDAVCHVYPKGLATAVVNLLDESTGRPVEVTGGFTTSCASGGEAPAWLALLALALPFRRHRAPRSARGDVAPSGAGILR